MPDPLTPIGSSGQLPLMAAVPLVTPQTPATESGQVELSTFKSAKKASARTPSSSKAETQKGDTVEAKVSEKKPSETISSASLEDSIQAFREYIKNLPSDLQFQPDQSSGLVIWKVVNPLTQEVIRQYPPEDVVAMARKIRELNAHQEEAKSGIFLDEQS